MNRQRQPLSLAFSADDAPSGRCHTNSGLLAARDNPEIAMVCGRSRFSHYRLAGRSLLDDLGKLVSNRGYSGGWKRCTRIVRFEKHVSNYLIIDWLLVRKGGFEPPRLSAPPPQDGVSASSTTSAVCKLHVLNNLAKSASEDSTDRTGFCTHLCTLHPPP